MKGKEEVVFSIVCAETAVATRAPGGVSPCLPETLLHPVGGSSHELGTRK